MQPFTLAALLIAGAFATDIDNHVASIASAAAEFGDSIQAGAFQRSSDYDWDSHLQKFSDSLDDFIQQLDQLPDNTDLGEQFNNDYANYESNVAKAVGNLNTYGNNVGGSDRVFDWASKLYNKHSSLNDLFWHKCGCYGYWHAWPHCKNADDAFSAIANDWEFSQQDRHWIWWPWYHRPDCPPTSTTHFPIHSSTSTHPTVTAPNTKPTTSPSRRSSSSSSAPTSTQPPAKSTQTPPPSGSSSYKCKIVEGSHSGEYSYAFA